MADMSPKLHVHRFPENPIIRPEMLPAQDGENINGPSLIRVPDWAPNRLGNYYLYFAHHGGKYIRLAYADKLEGPWKIHDSGTLHLSGAPICIKHIASPDVQVHPDRREIRMYFHCPTSHNKGQRTFVALSRDGLRFRAMPANLGIFYFRVFNWQNAWYAMAKGGVLYRSRDGLTGFEEGTNPFLAACSPSDNESRNSRVRHVALHLVKDTLWVYYTNIGDSPERILRSKIQLTDNWKNWKTSAPEEVLRPALEYEGVKLPLKPSRSGSAKGPENALRDPGIFVDDNGRVYLLYSISGESGIAMAELLVK